MTDDEHYDAAANSAGSYDVAIRALRMEGVKAGRFLPLPDRPDEIRASPVVVDVRRIGDCVLYNGDSTAIVALLSEHGPMIDACVTDPPYELGFMGKSWDSSGVAADWRTWGGVRIAMKPGAHLVAFAGSRTYHRIATVVDDAGFEVRDQIQWIYGSGFPKSMDVSKAIDKAAGKADERGYIETTGGLHGGSGTTVGKFTGRQLSSVAVTAAAAAAAWDGWGTALKPAHEPVVFARKPLSEDTIAANVLRWGTGAINVDGARVDGEDLGTRDVKASHARGVALGGSVDGTLRQAFTYDGGQGRWPANVVHDGSFEVLEAFPASARDAIRFFYAAKADKSDREFGLEQANKTRRAGTFGDGIGNTPKVNGERPNGRANHHPTVKPTDLMRWLVRLVTPPGGTVLDPFMGSGSTGIAAVREGCRFVGVERDPEYFDIACRRVAAAVAERTTHGDIVHEITKATRRLKKADQGSLL